MNAYLDTCLYSAVCDTQKGGNCHLHGHQLFDTKYQMSKIHN